jgi:TonB family protein
LSEFLDDVIANSPSLRNNVYREYLKMKPGFSGKVMLRITIAASGEVTDISIRSSTTDYPEFDKAVKDAVATWKWKPVKKWRLKVLYSENNSVYIQSIPFWFEEKMLK